ncbi:NAD-binding protein [Streptomyces sp. ADMS]|uniref:NAD-binding protein n=1 Tax=Streptomyces sp. ADMS TaxID=3071415 RepID=UPI003992C4FE
MVGGESGTVAFCRRVFATYGDPVVHVGPLGSGQVAKLLDNALFTANLATSADVLALGRTLDVDPAGLADVIAHGSGASFALARVAAAGGTLDRIATHGGPLLRKDARLPADLAEGAGVVAGTTVMRTADDALALMAQSAVITARGVRPVRGSVRGRRAG